MPIAKTHYVGLPVMAFIQALGWITGHQADIMTQATTILTGFFTAVSWILSQAAAIKQIRALPATS
ncbi:MAG: hypothetical protein ACREBJ_02290 [Nitrosotalea sp.]